MMKIYRGYIWLINFIISPIVYIDTITHIKEFVKINIYMNIFEIQRVANTNKLDHEFNNLLQEKYFLQKQAENRAAQIRKDVNMLAGVSVNGITLGAFYVVSAIMFQKIYDITGGTPLITF